MKIRTKSAGALALLAVASLATSCATDVETSVNTDPEGNAIRFAASVGRSARATETKLDNLGDFAVVARGMHPDGVLYDQYIIGASDGGEIAQKESGSTDTWKLNHDVYWPAALQRILFVGYTTLQSGESSVDGVLGSATFRINGNVPKISNFKPEKADLSKGSNAGSGIWADGADQKDLVVAFNAMDRGSSTAVSLKFRHALTQVSIQAGMKDKLESDHRIVKVKGAWIVNAAQSGGLSATITVDTEDKATYPTTNTTSWSSSVDLETYGSYYDDVINLTKNGNNDLLRGHSLMLIPQSLSAWDPKNPSVTTGAYIMLLCRVELEHDGETHSGSAGKDIAFKDGKHYHQLFPVNTTEYNGSEYGFVCVPLGTDWGNAGSPDAESGTTTTDLKGMGKHYTYKLDICGKKSGAGYYPPTPDASKLIPTGAKVTALVLQSDGTYKEENVDLTVRTDVPHDKDPNGKNIGSPVLDDPIQFTVTVNPWGDPSTDPDWKDGSDNLKM